jgi:2-hydroxy-3-oxopropionate reductase
MRRDARRRGRASRVAGSWAAVRNQVVMSEKSTIGFVGLGIMGLPMARNLLAAGYAVCALNRSPGPTATAVSHGATTARSAAALAAGSDVVITMLPDTPDVESVVLGADGVAAGLRPGSVFIDMSTIDPAMSRRCAAQLHAAGIEALDAPVSGGEKGAIEGTLSIMVGGAQAAFDRVLPILEVLGKNVTLIGEAGAGQIAKACNQLIVAVTIEAVAEALALASASGVDAAKVRGALLGGFAQSKILEVHGQRMLDAAYAPGFKAKLHKKDMGIVIAAETAAHLHLPAAELLRERMGELAARTPDADHSALRTLIATPGP